MHRYSYLQLGFLCLLLACQDAIPSDDSASKVPTAFPYQLPAERPERPLSSALERNYEAYMGARPETNELYSQFKYTKLKGFEYHDGDGTLSRRDPSKIIFFNGKYYVWYTHRESPVAPLGIPRAHESNDTIPSADWDLADIFYATSTDGFTWKEEGVAVPRPPKPELGYRSVTTTDILEWKGKYYLYYQGFSKAPGKNGGDDCPVLLSYADSPDGPWTPHNKIVIPNGAAGEWDQFSIHDPYPIVHEGKIYLYYKSDFARSDTTKLVRMHGLAIADDPLGPFTKHPLNPIMNSGHETTLFPFKEGIAAFAIRDGNEASTIQYAQDWVNFEIAATLEYMPNAAGPFVPDAFTDTQDGRGITWGLSHYTVPHGDWKRNHGVLLRFDCDLSLDVHDPQMKKHHTKPPIDFLYQQRLSEKQLQRIENEHKSRRGS